MARSTLLLLGAGLAAVCGCTTTQTRIEPIFQEVAADGTQPVHVPGVVEYVWEEPMVDVVAVPPGVDPEGHYYRPAHEAVVEIRQGRWRYYKAD